MLYEKLSQNFSVTITGKLKPRESLCEYCIQCYRRLELHFVTDLQYK